METTREFKEVDLSDAQGQRLAVLAGRLSNLLEQSGVAGNTEIASQLDDLLGALYSLALAHKNGFEDRIGKPIEVAAVQTRAKQLAAGHVRVDGKWIAGYYFNSGLLRLAAVQHRILQLLTGRDKSVPKLHRILEKTAKYTHENLDIVHSQVNELKHAQRGVYDSRAAQYANAIDATEELLTIFEYWSSTKRLQNS